MYSAWIENGHFPNIVFYACQTIHNRPGTFERVPMHTLVQVEDILSIFFVNCVLINHKNSTPIKLGTCVVNVLCQLWVKYCRIQEFIVEHNLSIKLKDHSLPDYIYVKCFLCCDAKNSLLKFAQAICIHSVYCSSFSSFFARRKFVDVKRSLYLMLDNVLGVFFQHAQNPGARSLGQINFVRRRQCL